MITWDLKTNDFSEIPQKQIDFLNDIKIIYEKHNLSISHEDVHGGFIIENFNQENIDWLFDASINW